MGIIHVLNGRLDAAIERVRGWRRHFTSDESHELIEVSEALVERGEPYTYDEARVLGLGERLSLLTRSQPKEPRPPSPFDERVKVAEEQLEEATTRHDEAVQELTDARGAQKTAKEKLGVALGERDDKGIAAAEAELDEALARATRAEADVLISDTRWLRAKSRVTALKAARSRWWMEQESTFRDRNGKVVPLAELR